MNKPPNLKLVSPLEAVGQAMEFFDSLSDTNLTLAVMTFVKRASHKQLRDVITQAQLRLTSPCTELCEEDCYQNDDN